MGKAYRIGLIGAGARGEVFAKQLNQGLPRATLAALCDINRQRLEGFAEYCGVKNVPLYTDAGEMFADPRVDAVIVTAPEFAHADLAVGAMAAGKHVYLEKPLAHTIEDCHRIIEAHRRSSVTAFVGFNLRASPARQKLRQIIHGGELGQIIHIEGLEQLSQAHAASFMRRFHRWSSRSGGLLNTKCSHDLDMLQWLLGHEHRVTKLSSFGGCRVFTPGKRPATHCSQCPTEIHSACPYKATAGYVFPITASAPMYHPDQPTYGSDLCVYNDDKDIVDNQTVLLEWDHGVTGVLSMQTCQHAGGRRNRVVGELGFAELDEVHLASHGETTSVVRVVASNTGDVTEHRFAKRPGGHGGSDRSMINLFVDAIERGGENDSGLSAGLAATLLALKADESRLNNRQIALTAADYA
jgi:predicted dehydrogenase